MDTVTIGTRRMKNDEEPNSRRLASILSRQRTTKTNGPGGAWAEGFRKFKDIFILQLTCAHHASTQIVDKPRRTIPKNHVVNSRLKEANNSMWKRFLAAQSEGNGPPANGLTNSTEDTESETDFETALKVAKPGKYHIFLLTIGGLIYIAYGCQNGLSSYIIPAARCDLKLSLSEKGYLNAAYFVGCMIGLSLWGAISDEFGRHKIIVISLTLDATVSFFACFSTNFAEFVTGRFLNGILVSGAGSLVCPYVAEFATEKHMPVFLSIIGILYTLSSIMLATVGVNIASTINSNYFNSWRSMVLMPCVLSYLCAVLMVIFLPESPKFLYSKGKDTEALALIRHIYKINNGALATFPVKKLIPMGESMMKVTPRRKSAKAMFFHLCREYSLIFRYPHLSKAALLIFLMFTNMVAYMGMGNWLPEIIDRFHEYSNQSNESMTLCEITETFVIVKNYTNMCLLRNSDPEVYKHTYVIAVGSFVGAFFNTAIVIFVGLKFSSVLCSIAASGLILVTYFLKDALSISIVASLFLLLLQNACMCFICFNCELFPTRIRGSVSCLLIMVGRMGAAVGNVIFGHYLDTNCNIPIFSAIACTIASGFMSLMIPQTGSERLAEKSSGNQEITSEIPVINLDMEPETSLRQLTNAIDDEKTAKLYLDEEDDVGENASAINESLDASTTNTLVLKSSLPENIIPDSGHAFERNNLHKDNGESLSEAAKNQKLSSLVIGSTAGSTKLPFQNSNTILMPTNHVSDVVTDVPEIDNENSKTSKFVSTSNSDLKNAPEFNATSNLFENLPNFNAITGFTRKTKTDDFNVVPEIQTLPDCLTTTEPESDSEAKPKLNLTVSVLPYSEHLTCVITPEIMETEQEFMSETPELETATVIFSSAETIEPELPIPELTLTPRELISPTPLANKLIVKDINYAQPLTEFKSPTVGRSSLTEEMGTPHLKMLSRTRTAPELRFQTEL